jgi:hypothetical protein
MRFPYVVLLSACSLMWTATLLAQSINGVINGLVVDPSTGIIVGADVVVVNDVTGVRYTTKTNSEGIYVLPNLPPGPYRLQVSKTGFKTIIKPDIVLNLQDALSINFTLPIGASYETVTVEAGASMINTTDASVSTVVDQTYVKDMPLNGRSFQDLILLTPGTVTLTPQSSSIMSGLGISGEFSVNGQRPESNYYTVDGVSANTGAVAGANMLQGAGSSGSVSAATALGTTQALVSVDDLQEFRVQSSTYSAEYGRNPGGQFVFETKSGTNQWHGTAYDYVRNGLFDAQDWFNDYFGLTQPILRQNDFGGTLGGPVEIPRFYQGKDKTFFFVSYEGLRLAAPQAATVNYVPDTTLRANTPSPLNQALNAFPMPNGPDIGNGVAEYIGSWSDPGSVDSTSVRIDHAISNKLRLFFRFSDTPSTSTTRPTSAQFETPSNSQTITYISRTYTAAANSLFTDNLDNEFRLNFSSTQTRNSLVIDGFGGNTPVHLLQLSGLNPGDAESVLLFLGAYDVFLQEATQSAIQKQWNLVDSISLSHGAHRFKFGIDYRRLAPDAIQPAFVLPYYYIGIPAVTSNAPFTLPATTPPIYPLYLNFSAFSQNEWKASRHFTLSVGLRWEVNPAPSVTKGLKPYAVLGATPDTWALAPQGTPLWQTTWFNFAPRLGGAYILHDAPGRETVLRIGAGVFFDTGQQLGSIAWLGPGFNAQVCCPAASFPRLPVGGIPTVVNPPVAPYNTTLYGFPSNLKLPYTVQWNSSIEQAFGKSQTLTASYVGSHAARLLKQENFAPSNPNIPGAVFSDNGLTSDFDSLQVQFRRRLSGGLTTLASYTWSHCIDYGSQDYNDGYQRGNCDFDVRHNLSAAFSYNTPKIGHDPVMSGLLNHWGLDSRFTARTGFPVTLNGTQGLDTVTGQLFNAGLDLVSGQPIYVRGATCAALYSDGRGCPGGRAVNPNAFALPPTDPNTGNPIRLGNAPRNFVDGFGAWQMDLAVRREFPVRERLRLQFRAEAFNLFNHPNFGTINSNFGTQTFGQATATLANSLGVLSPLYQQGGPRSLQFALKLVF